jgi:hypothetical protein
MRYVDRATRRRGAALLGLVVAALTTSAACSSGSARRYVRDARIAPSSRGDGNWVAPGSSTVLLLREFDEGAYFTLDDEHFEKLSIELPHARTGDRFGLEDDGVKVLLTNGSAAWAFKGAYCTAATGSGEIVIVQHRAKRGLLTARLALVLDCEDHVGRSPGGALPQVRQVRIDGEYEFCEIAYDDLTPWLGRDEDATGYRAFADHPNAGR